MLKLWGLGHSHWLALVTMTTVGFGDYTPKSSYGITLVILGCTCSLVTIGAGLAGVNRWPIFPKSSALVQLHSTLNLWRKAIEEGLHIFAFIGFFFFFWASLVHLRSLLSTISTLFLAMPASCRSDFCGNHFLWVFGVKPLKQRFLMIFVETLGRWVLLAENFPSHGRAGTVSFLLSRLRKCLVKWGYGVKDVAWRNSEIEPNHSSGEMVNQHEPTPTLTLTLG